MSSTGQVTSKASASSVEGSGDGAPATLAELESDLLKRAREAFRPDPRHASDAEKDLLRRARDVFSSETARTLGEPAASASSPTDRRGPGDAATSGAPPEHGPSDGSSRHQPVPDPAPAGSSDLLSVGGETVSAAAEGDSLLDWLYHEAETTTVGQILVESLAGSESLIGLFAWPDGEPMWANEALAGWWPEPPEPTDAPALIEERSLASLFDRRAASVPPALPDLLSASSRAVLYEHALPGVLEKGRWRGVVDFVDGREGGTAQVLTTLIAHRRQHGRIDVILMVAEPLSVTAPRVEPDPPAGSVPSAGRGASALPHVVDEKLRRALDEGGLQILYQPVVDPDSRPVGAEALLRIRDEGGELLSPGAFVDAAESSGLIARLGAAVLQLTCEEIATMSPGGNDRFDVSVNVSPRQIASPDFGADVERILASTGLDPSRLWLEITEGAVLGRSDASDVNIGRLREMGVRIGFDEFGSRHASIGALRRFPLDFVKIDRSLVGGLGVNYVDRAIVRSSIDLAHQLDLTVVGVGVESDDQFAALREIGCDRAQGFFFAPPLDAVGMAGLAARLPQA